MISGFRKENLVAELSVRAHTLLSGVLEEQGGHDEGISPHEMLEASLAACTIITVQMYADRKKWPLVSTHVDVKVVSESKEATQISRKIKFVGSLDDEQMKRLAEIANKCPIHNLLESKIKIETSVDPVETNY